MPNLVLTNYCNRACPYCFARESMASAPPRELGWIDLIKVADMLVASGRPKAGVLGGEPSLHPQFVPFVRYLMQRGIKPVIFTNGICDPHVMNALEGIIDGADLSFVVNVNHPDIERPENGRQQEDFIRRFAEHCDLGVNVFSADIELDFLADLAERTEIEGKRIRVGLAQPVATGTNRYLPLSDYSRIPEKLVRLASRVYERGIRLSLDCGFTLCSFTDEQLGRLHRLGGQIRFYCVPAIDIAPSLDIWSCFPLVDHTIRRYPSVSYLKDLQEHFGRVQSDLRSSTRPGVFEECDTCVHRHQKLCHGGCIAHAVMDRSDGA